MYDKVIEIGNWMPITEIPTKDSKAYKNLQGVYQVTESKYIQEIGDKLVHDKINYTGTGKDLMARSYGMRADQGDHSVNHYIKIQHFIKDETNRVKIDKGDVVIRYVETSTVEEGAALEKKIHTDSKNAFGKHHRWNECSSGPLSKLIYALSIQSELSLEHQISSVNILKEIAHQSLDQQF